MNEKAISQELIDEMIDALQKAEKALDATRSDWPKFGEMIEGHKAIESVLAKARAFRDT